MKYRKSIGGSKKGDQSMAYVHTRFIFCEGKIGVYAGYKTIGFNADNQPHSLFDDSCLAIKKTLLVYWKGCYRGTWWRGVRGMGEEE